MTPHLLTQAGVRPDLTRRSDVPKSKRPPILVRCPNCKRMVPTVPCPECGFGEEEDE